jgi:uncharacterized protein YdeI (YjbR/CyaY-like superfamily)
MEAHYFNTPAEFRAWLEENHTTATELLVGFYKRGGRETGITYQEALEQALSFGWIDGVRRKVDDQRWTIRFSPRKARSIWSGVNTKRVEELMAQGLMHPAGLEAFAARDEARSGVYAYERPQSLDPEFEQQLRDNAAAWHFWQAQPPWYRRTASSWVMSAKRDDTRRRRLATLIDDSAHQRRIGLLNQTRG